MKKKLVSLSRPNSASQKTPCEEMAMELKRKHDAITDREIELTLYAQSKSCDPKQAKQVKTIYQCALLKFSVLTLNKPALKLQKIICSWLLIGDQWKVFY